MKKRWIKLLWVSIFVLQVAFIAILAISAASIYTNIMTLAGSLMGGEEEEPIKTEQDPTTGATRITFSFEGENRGVLEVLMSIRMRILSNGNQVLKESQDSARIPAGSMRTLTASLEFTKEEWEAYEAGTLQPVMEIFFEIRTFFDLIGFGMEMQVKAR